MKLLELLALADESSALRITLDGEYVVAHYDGHDSIDEEYNDCEVNSMFPTTISAYDALGREYQKPYISIDIASKEYVEIMNADRLCMLDRLDEMHNIAFGVIYLHDEDAAATEAALRGRKPHGNITRGLYYRGI